MNAITCVLVLAALSVSAHLKDAPVLNVHIISHTHDGKRYTALIKETDVAFARRHVTVPPSQTSAGLSPWETCTVVC